MLFQKVDTGTFRELRRFFVFFTPTDVFRREDDDLERLLRAELVLDVFLVVFERLF